MDTEGSMAQHSEHMQQFRQTAQAKITKHQCAPISSIMTSDVITMFVNDKLEDSLRIFRQHSLLHLVVVNERKEVKGIFTKRDLLSVEKGGLNRSIRCVANEKVHMVSKTTCIRKVASMMLTYKIGCVPIVQEATNILVGIVTESDFVRAFAMSTKCNCGVFND